MFKLVAVAGKLRGKEFVLEEGENVLGRDDGCDIPISVNGVSKKHLSVTVAGGAAYVQDLGSSNGTFLNGKIVKRATVRSGDKIALPDLILQVVFVKEKKVIIKKKAESEEEEEVESLDKIPPPPQKLPQKLLWIFRYKIMPVVHGINEEYEWRVMVAILLGIFIFLVISSTIFPVLQDSRQILLLETAKRGEHFAEEIARLNAKALEQRNLDRVDSNFLDNEGDVASYELFDLEGRIVRPMGKLNEYISDTFSIKGREWALTTANKQTKAYIRQLDDGEIGIAQKIMAYNVRTGVSEAVGVIAIRFTPKSLALDATKNSVAFLESLVTSGIFAIFLFGILYFLTIKPLDEIRVQAEEVLRGRRRNVESKYMFEEANALRSTVNSILQRIRELQNDGPDEFEEAEDSGPYINTLIEFLQGCNGPAMVLDSEKNLQKINHEAEDITGIRESGSEGMSLLDVAREQGFAATVIELCDDSASNQGTHQSGTYELSGHDFAVNVAALMGKDGFAKAFYITFVQED